MLDTLSDKFRDSGADSKVGSEISKARRALTAKTPDPQKAFAAMTKAMEEYRAQKEWRAKAIPLTPGISAYEAAIRNTIGLRLLDRMPRDTALSVAACSAGHRDISLNF
jgi:hypothetical protein